MYIIILDKGKRKTLKRGEANKRLGKYYLEYINIQNIQKTAIKRKRLVALLSWALSITFLGQFYPPNYALPKVILVLIHIALCICPMTDICWGYKRGMGNSHINIWLLQKQAKSEAGHCLSSFDFTSDLLSIFLALW